MHYQAPHPMVEPVQPQSAAKWLAIIGSVLLLSLPLGLAATVTSMVHMFHDTTAQGAGDPRVISGGISSALGLTALGLVFAFLGSILLYISTVFFKYRKPWVFRVALAAAIVALFVFPIGTIIAVVALKALSRNKSSFY